MMARFRRPQMRGDRHPFVRVAGIAAALFVACSDESSRTSMDDGIDSAGSTTGVGTTSGDTDSAGPPDSTTSADADSASGPGADDSGTKFDLGIVPDAPVVCVNLQCHQVTCPGGGTTTVRGTVYDPSGTLPLYNAQVYVPNAEVEPFEDDLVCDQCDTQVSGSPVVTAVTDEEGNFVLEDVPATQDVPLVMQIGKWRRQITIPNVQACTETVLDDPETTRLPRSTLEGDLPRIALTTGGCDPLFCLLRRLGIDDQEFGVMGSPARIHFYQGSGGSSSYDGGFGASPGATFPSATTTLWNNGWENYDIVMLSCECSEQPAGKDGHRVKLRDYLDAGGRVFGTHYHYNWMQGDAPADLASIATFTTALNAFSGLVDINTTFPKGLALADWMMAVGGSTQHGQFHVDNGRVHTLTLDAALATDWVNRLGTPVYFSFNAPIGADDDEQCGRMVQTDIHVSAGSASGSFPTACNAATELSAQEKALLYMLFDLSACIQPDDNPVLPPPPG
jgi:hypothetical protein